SACASCISASPPLVHRSVSRCPLVPTCGWRTCGLRSRAWPTSCVPTPTSCLSRSSGPSEALGAEPASLRGHLRLHERREDLGRAPVAALAVEKNRQHHAVDSDDVAHPIVPAGLVAGERA